MVGVESKKLYEDAQVLLQKILKEKRIRARGVMAFFPANSEGDDILLYEDDSRKKVRARLHGLRQQMARSDGEPNRCLTDFVAPVSSGKKDYLGAFAVTTGHGVEKWAKELEKENDDYQPIAVRRLLRRRCMNWRGKRGVLERRRG